MVQTQKPTNPKKSTGPRKTAIVRLDENLQITIGLIEDLEGNIGNCRKILSDIDQVLGYPDKIDKDLKKVSDVLSAVQTTASIISVLPEIGAPAGAVARVLKPVVKAPKPPGGVIGEMRVGLKEIITMLKPARDTLKRIKKPVDSAYDDTDKLRLKIVMFQSGVKEIIREHGAHPPAGVQKCAAKLNKILVDGLSALKAASKAATKQLAPFNDLLSEMEDQLNNLMAYIDTVENLLSNLTGRAFRKFKRGMEDVERHVNQLKNVLKALFRAVCEKLGIPIDDLIAGLHRLEGRIEAFISDIINRAVKALINELTNLLKNFPAYEALKELFDQLQTSVNALRDMIEDKLGGECAKKLATV